MSTWFFTYTRDGTQVGTVVAYDIQTTSTRKPEPAKRNYFHSQGSLTYLYSLPQGWWSYAYRLRNLSQSDFNVFKNAISNNYLVNSWWIIDPSSFSYTVHDKTLYDLSFTLVDYTFYS